MTSLQERTGRSRSLAYRIRRYINKAARRARRGIDSELFTPGEYRRGVHHQHSNRAGKRNAARILGVQS